VARDIFQPCPVWIYTQSSPIFTTCSVSHRLVWITSWISFRVFECQVLSMFCITGKKCPEIYIIFRSAMHSACHSAMPFRLLHSPSVLLISNSMVSRAIWKKIHSWVFQRFQIALVLRTRVIFI
jgi:hypothetical protein